MDGIERILDVLDRALYSKKRRHIAGGILMSASLLFAGLAITVLTLKGEQEKDEYEEYGYIE